MFRRSLLTPSSAIIHEFVDPSYLGNKRPLVPSGAWPVELLRKKSFADLQQIWFAILKERNMVASTKHHYVVHQEELGAFPAPSRIKLIDESLANIKLVIRERDFKATDKAMEIFRDRIKRGVYTYPPGPPLPPEHGLNISKVKIISSKKIPEERIRELFGRYDVYEDHKGIANVLQTLTDEALEQKAQAEIEWDYYVREKKRYEEYHSFDSVKSIYDNTAVELAPGVFHGVKAVGNGLYEPTGDELKAVEIVVPAPKEEDDTPKTSLERLLWMDKPQHMKEPIHFCYFPLNTTEPPQEPPQRPVHPDEIEGPWITEVTYDSSGGYSYACELGVTRVDGADILGIEDIPITEPYCTRDPVYQEAVNMEEAEAKMAYKWPHVPAWKEEYRSYTKKKTVDVIQYNYSNVVDYVDREVLLTSKSVWDLPIDVDYSCGGIYNVPAHAQDVVRDKYTKGNYHNFK